MGTKAQERLELRKRRIRNLQDPAIVASYSYEGVPLEQLETDELVAILFSNDGEFRRMNFMDVPVAQLGRDELVGILCASVKNPALLNNRSQATA
jgi:hypothetical protein